MVLVFKTDVEDHRSALELIKILDQEFPGTCINFDLDDCDRILRVVSEADKTDAVQKLLRELSYNCEPLD